MRVLTAILLSAGLFLLAGCNEFVQPETKTTSVDVVGEPADAAPDSMRQADILGSAVPSSDDGAPVGDFGPTRSLYEGSPTTIIVGDTPPNSVETEGEPDVAGGLGLAKPVSMKKQKPENQATKQSRP